MITTAFTRIRTALERRLGTTLDSDEGMEPINVALIVAGGIILVGILIAAAQAFLESQISLWG